MFFSTVSNLFTPVILVPIFTFFTSKSFTSLFLKSLQIFHSLLYLSVFSVLLKTFMKHVKLFIFLCDISNNEVFIGPTLLTAASAGFTHGDLCPCVLTENCFSRDFCSYLRVTEGYLG